MPKAEMRVIALGNQKGGVGKSAACINLACQAAAAGLNVAILDMDGEQGTSLKWSDRRNGHATQITVASADVANLKRTLDGLRETHAEWVFIDLPGRATTIASAGFMASDLVLIPCRPLDVDIEASVDTVSRVSRANKKYAFLMNIAPSSNDMLRARMMQGFLRSHGHSVANPIIVQRIEVPDAIANGEGVNEFKPSSKSNQEFADLFAWLKKEVRK